MLLRVAHNGYHNALGLPRGATDVTLWLMSGLMMLPLHAVKVTHLEHHKHCLGELDIEGEAGRKSFWSVVAYGPRLPIDVLRAAWREGLRAAGTARARVPARPARALVRLAPAPAASARAAPRLRSRRRGSPRRGSPRRRRWGTARGRGWGGRGGTRSSSRRCTRRRSPRGGTRRRPCTRRCARTPSTGTRTPVPSRSSPR